MLKNKITAVATTGGKYLSAEMTLKSILENECKVIFVVLKKQFLF